jgi:hypothetical protein
VSRLHLHPENHLVARIGWLRAAVLGANDGIVSTASLIVGVAAATATQNDVLIAGIAGLVAGADTALDINVRQLIELKFWIVLQFLAFARQIRLFGIRLRTDGHILAGRTPAMSLGFSEMTTARPVQPR